MKFLGKYDYYCCLNDNICDIKVIFFIWCGVIEINYIYIWKEN